MVSLGVWRRKLFRDSGSIRRSRSISRSMRVFIRETKKPFYRLWFIAIPITFLVFSFLLIPVIFVEPNLLANQRITERSIFSVRAVISRCHIPLWYLFIERQSKMDSAQLISLFKEVVGDPAKVYSIRPIEQTFQCL